MGESYRDSRHGFVWGPAEVVRVASHKGSVWLLVQTGKQEVEIRVTPSGLIRVGPVKKRTAKP